MAEEFNEKGVITKTSKDFSIVSITINEEPRSFSFRKTLFYTFGVQCEGSMANILDEGMDVELCYRISYPGSKPSIIAVWLGDKPDIVTEDKTAPRPVYDKTGRVVRPVDNNNFLVQDEDNNAILINNVVAFRDGSPLKENVPTNEEVNFDAIPFEFDHHSGASYQATCAWVGQKPRLVDRFSLRSLEDSVTFSGEEFVDGTVAVIPNDVVAFVDVALESMTIKVLLFRCSFNGRFERIQDVVNVGDRLCLRLGYGYLFRGSKQWYAVRACKTSDEVNSDSDVNVCEERAPDQVKKTEIAYRTGTPRSQFGTSSETFYHCKLPGLISRLPDDNKACISYENFKILVTLENFYVHGERCARDDFVNYITPGTNKVYFDAIPTKFACVDEGGFTHEATCAWVGRKYRPKLDSILAIFPPPKPLLLSQKGRFFYGIAFKFHLPSKAFLDVPVEGTTVVVSVSNFVAPPQYPPENDTEEIIITDYVKLNDVVEFKVQEHPNYPHLLSAFDARPAVLSREMREEIESMSTVSRRSCEKPTPSLDSRYEGTSENPFKTKVRNGNAVSLKPPDVPQAVLVPSKVSAPLTVSKPSASSVSYGVSLVKKMRLSLNRGFLLNCEGRLKVEVVDESVVLKVEHIFGTSVVNDLISSDFLLDSDRTVKVCHNSALRFDAEFVMSPDTNRDFRIVRMWGENADRTKSEHLLISELKTNRGFPDGVLNAALTKSVYELASSENGMSVYPFGTIKSIPLHDSAIAIVENVPVLVAFESLQTNEEINSRTSSIETFLQVGDRVLTLCEKQESKGVPYFQAHKCLFFTERSRGSKLQIILPRKPTTRSNIWSLGECYRKEKVVRKDGGFFVEFVSSKCPGLALSLNLFEKDKVFINGNSATPKMLEEFVGCEITFHVCHKHSDALSSSVKGMHVSCAWIGTEPSPYLILEDALVPKQSVCPAWLYEAVVESFPLPSYALCSIGCVPVLVKILNKTGEEALPDLKIGDRIVIQVTEKPVGDSVIVVSNAPLNLWRSLDLVVKDVYRNLTGTIVVLPEPVGKIKVADADFEVSFELCHMRKFGNSSGQKKWFASVREKLFVGKQVYVSATKNVSNFKKVPYRAFEVYFVE